MDIYEICPTTELERFTIRLIREEDAPGLFTCYHDSAAIARMNDDNCDFGFYVDTPENMANTLRYWLDFYRRKCFVRFALVDKQTGKAVGTIEGFGGDVGVLRLDLASTYETAACLCELFRFAQENFKAWFGNSTLVTKAIPSAAERRKALETCGWNYIGQFRSYSDYYQIDL